MSLFNWEEGILLERRGTKAMTMTNVRTPVDSPGDVVCDVVIVVSVLGGSRCCSDSSIDPFKS